MQKINKFYLTLVILLLMLTFLVVIVVRVIFGSLMKSREIDSEFLESQTPRLEKQVLIQIDEKLDEQKAKILDLKL